MKTAATFAIDFYPQNGGSFEDCDADFLVEWEDADPSVGANRPTATATFVSCMIGTLEVTREMLVQMLTNRRTGEGGEADVAEIEAGLGGRLSDEGPDYYDPDYAAECAEY